MGFTSTFFLFIFIPGSIIIYYLMTALEHWKIFRKLRVKDIALILISVLFYGWTGLEEIIFIGLYVLAVYVLGICISFIREKKLNFLVAFISILSLTGVLFYFKYTNFVFQLLKLWFSIGIKHKISWVPLGISFITFSAISYVVDVYRGDAAKGSFIDVALYLTFFPKVVSGPIVLWKQFCSQIKYRKISIDNFFEGLNRIMIGFAKKVILADYFGTVVSSIQEQVEYGIDCPTAWLCVLLYTLQIYFDFAGYSDIAIGLASIFGIKFEENFKFPYTATSITDFWRKWHISLGTWFKEYVYIPLGGNRKGRIRTLVNLGIVFLITGIWHGAGGNYIFWGILHGTFRIFEKCVEKKNWYQKIPDLLKWAVTMFVVAVGWQAFRFSNLKDLFEYYSIMFGATKFKSENIFFQSMYFLDKKTIVMSGIGIVGATLFSSEKLQKIVYKLRSYPVGLIMQEGVLLGLMIISVICMVNSTYSPFIYFQY